MRTQADTLDRPPPPWADPWQDDPPPLLRKAGFRRVVAVIATGSLLILAVFSTCSPRRTDPGDRPTTTTTQGRLALEPTTSPGTSE